jgi:hypothetical protein
MNVGATRTKELLIQALLALSVVCAVVSQVAFDIVLAKQNEGERREFRYIIPEEIVRHMTLGFHNLLADWYWLRAIQELAYWDGESAYYPKYFFNSSTLDPMFEAQYKIGALTIPSRGNTTSYDWAEALAQRGIIAFPSSWEIPFLAGVGLNIASRNTERSIKYLEMAASAPDSPEIVRRTYAIYLMNDKTANEKSRALFEAMAGATNSEDTKRVARERLLLIDFIELLEKLVAQYQTIHGSPPSSLDVLLAGTLGVPEELKKYHIAIDPLTGEVRFGR